MAGGCHAGREPARRLWCGRWLLDLCGRLRRGCRLLCAKAERRHYNARLRLLDLRFLARDSRSLLRRNGRPGCLRRYLGCGARLHDRALRHGACPRGRYGGTSECSRRYSARVWHGRLYLSGIACSSCGLRRFLSLCLRWPCEAWRCGTPRPRYAFRGS